MFPYFKNLSREEILQLTNVRPGEQKLGEVIQTATDLAAALANPGIRYVLLGIPEDIGVRANGGIGGAHSLWGPFLRAFLNVQAQKALKPGQVLLLGSFQLDDLMQASETADLAALRALTARVDEAVFPLIQQIIAAGKLPIVIGGGHNNAYPLLRGAATAMGRPLNCINLDAHADYRATEGRHSGNGFRYAKEQGYLKRYAAIGLHRNYNQEAIMETFATEPDLFANFYDDIIAGETDFNTLIQQGLQHAATVPMGMELDLDCIAGVLASAATPSGITAAAARAFVATCAQAATLAYAHFTEGATRLRDGRRDETTAKLVAYLVTDLIRYSK